MSNHPKSYYYEHGSGAAVHHLRNDPSSRLRPRSLRISHLPPKSEDVTFDSVNEEDLPEDQRAFNPPSPLPLPSPPPSVNEHVAHDDSYDSLDNNSPSRTPSPPFSSASSTRPAPTRSAKKSRNKRKSPGGKKKRRNHKSPPKKAYKVLVLFLSMIPQVMTSNRHG
jgi:hypothetical protein